MQLNILILQPATVCQRVNRVADTKSCIPQRTQEIRERLFDPGEIRLILKQQQNVNVRVRKQFASAVAANCCDCEITVELGPKQGTNGARYNRIGEIGSSFEQSQRIAVYLKGVNYFRVSGRVPRYRHD